MTELFLPFAPIVHSLTVCFDLLGVLGHHGMHIANDALVLAQSTDADLVKEVQEAFKNFVETGQVWAMLIGLIVGYFVRGFTFYG